MQVAGDCSAAYSSMDVEPAPKTAPDESRERSHERRRELIRKSHDHEGIGIIEVLYALAALKERPGSLEPKVIDLLSQVLALAETEPNNPESLLDSEVNCVLFETIKEELKGQLLAGLVEYTQEKALKNAIKKIANLVHFANERKKKKEKEKAKMNLTNAAIAKEMATVLVRYVKKDLSQDELEQFVKTVVSMAKPSEDIVNHTYHKSGSEITGDDEKSKCSPLPAASSKQKQPQLAFNTGEKRKSSFNVSSISSRHQRSVKRESSRPLPDHGRKSRRPYKSYRYGRRSRSRTYSSYRNHRSLLPLQEFNYIYSYTDSSTERFEQKNDKMKQFGRLATVIENHTDNILKKHKENPEKHPQYNYEWRRFWRKRSEELQGEGKDAQTYDFTPEWIVFWKKRLAELHSSEIKVKIDALRKRLELPEESAPIFEITGKNKIETLRDDNEDSSKPAFIASIPNQGSDVTVTKDDTMRSKRSHSPWETGNIPHKSLRSHNKYRAGSSQAELEQLNTVIDLTKTPLASSTPITVATFTRQHEFTEDKFDLSPIDFPNAPAIVGALQTTEVKTSTSNMGGLSESDLQFYLQNFKNLSQDTQHRFIWYIKELEARQPEKVERLRKFVNLNAGSDSDDEDYPSEDVLKAAKQSVKEKKYC